MLTVNLFSWVDWIYLIIKIFSLLILIYIDNFINKIIIILMIILLQNQ